MISGKRGIGNSDDGQEFSYHGCPQCNFKKMPEEGGCEKCCGVVHVKRYLLYVTIVDPTRSVEGTAYHDAASELLKEPETLVKPLVALVHLAPDNRNPTKHALEILGSRRCLLPTVSSTYFVLRQRGSIAAMTE